MNSLLAHAFPKNILVACMLSVLLLPGGFVARDNAAAPKERTFRAAASTTGAGGNVPPHQSLFRHDTVMGTGDDRSYIGRDMDTGDRILESRGRPRHQDRPHQQTPMVIVPEVNVNGTWGQPQGGQQQDLGTGIMRPSPLPPGGIGTVPRQ